MQERYRTYNRIKGIVSLVTHRLFSATCHLLPVLCALLLAATLSLRPAYAQEPSVDEINEVAEDLNCPTCAGVSLADCNTQTCAQWKSRIGDMLSEGYNKEQILEAFATDYGVQVLQEPPRSGFTLLLWTLPFIILIIGGIWLFFTLRRWSEQELEPVTVVAAPETRTDPFRDAGVSDDYLKQVEQDLDNRS